MTVTAELVPKSHEIKQLPEKTKEYLYLIIEKYQPKYKQFISSSESCKKGSKCQMTWHLLTPYSVIVNRKLT